MIYEAKYSKLAIRDLDRVYFEVFEASKDYDTTENYINELMNKAESFSKHPQTGIPLYYENNFTGYYYTPFKAYIIFYHIEEQALLIDRILYGKSDYMRTLFKNITD